MSAAIALPLNFRVGARTLASLPRRLVRVALTLEEAMAGGLPPLPPLADDADGYSLLSLPVGRAQAAGWLAGKLLVAERQRYRRYFTDLAIGWEAYHAALSGNLRSTLKRKAKKLAGEGMAITRHRTPDELAGFHALARPLAAETYQERLLAMGLPGDDRFVDDMLRRGAAGEVRAWLMTLDGKAVAYLYCPVRGGTVVYEYVGHDARYDALSPGTVLMAEAMRDMMADPALARFDFTEGEGQHKRQFATGHVDCCDVLLLRPGAANRAALAALTAWDSAVATAKRVRR
ncbi:GNAT family N-acetyltransferase [Sphingomonas sp.]